MTAKLKQLNNRGFTIVETLIVLAIAAVIIIIVLLAVPALQRTTRNTDIKNDAAAIAGAINDFESNNGGSLPTTIKKAANQTQVYLCTTATTANCTKGKTGSSATVQSGDTVCVETSQGTDPTFGTASCTAPTVINTGYITVDLQETCTSTTGNNSGSTGGASGNQAAVFYPGETGGGSGNIYCIQA